MLLELENVDGFFIITDAIDQDEEKQLINDILKNKGEQCDQIHPAHEFGWKFIEITKNNKAISLGEFPEYIKNIWNKMSSVIKNELPDVNNDDPNHALINMYLPGDGCKEHIDSHIWTDYVFGLNLGSTCTFRIIDLYDQYYDVVMPNRSIYVMVNNARYACKHGITFDKVDNFYGDLIERNTRYSITFRTIQSKYLS